MLIPKKPLQEPDAKPLPPLMKAAGIQDKLQEAEGDLAALERHHAQAALDSVLSGNSDSLMALEADMAKANNKVKTLKAALIAALRADEDTRRAILKAQNQSKIKSVKASLAIADKATESFTAALAEAIKQYKTIIDQRNKVHSVVAGGGILPAGNYFCQETALKRLAAEEIARLSGPPALGGECLFPGGFTDERNRYQPEKITPIAETLHLANQSILNLMVGKVG